jgi:putative teichoic acid/polysaccharide glycosyl transferase
MKKRKILFLIGIAFIFLLIGTKSSPLYKINDWYDAECFFTMGKSMMIGKVPYLDLFEQKGPLLFLIYGIASIISTNSFIGVFILEVISYTIFLYYIDKIITLYIDEKYSYILLPILSLLILSSRSFTHGGSCEEFCFPILAITLYHFLNYLKNDIISNRNTILIGIMSGLILWTKYTLLGLNVGFCIVLLINEITKKNYKELLTKIGYFLLGILITTIPWLIYFGLHKNGIKSLIDTYFLFNITSYADDISILQKLINCFHTVNGVLIKYYQYIILIIIPMILSIKTKVFFKNTKNNIYLLLITLLLLNLLFIGGTNFRYYSLPMQPFMIFGLIYIFYLLSQTEINKFLKKNILLISVITTSICLITSYYRSPNTEYLKKEKSYYAQYTFLNYIKPNTTLLNYNFLDGGFYFTTKTYPTEHYFQKNNIKYHLFPQNIDSQRKYVKEKRTDYVVTTNKISKKDLKILNENYKLIASHKQKYEGHLKTYYLYEKR